MSLNVIMPLQGASYNDDLPVKKKEMRAKFTIDGIV